ncbi:MAG: hypothetical protein ACOC1V_08095 [Candidatus Saliniplasma sp.]
MTEHEYRAEKEGIDIEVQTCGCKVEGGALLKRYLTWWRIR